VAQIRLMVEAEVRPAGSECGCAAATLLTCLAIRLTLSNVTYNNEDRQLCIWTYQVRPEAEQEFVGLLARHWPTLRELGFVTDDPPMRLRSTEDPPVYVEIMTFEAAGMRPAHDHPDVIPIWEKMKALVEDRVEDRNVAGMSFPFYRAVELSA